MSRRFEYADLVGLDPLWRRRAKCRGESIVKWSAVEFGRGAPMRVKALQAEEDARAKVMCAGCPVRRECAVDAHLTRASDVVQAGYSLPSLSTGDRRTRIRRELATEFDLLRITACEECGVALRLSDDVARDSISLTRSGLCPDCKQQSELEIQRRDRESKRKKRSGSDE